MNKSVIILYFLSGVFISEKSWAQDPMFTGFNYSPTYFNPALSGCGKNNLRLSASSKVQWFNLYKPYKYFAGGADFSVYDANQRNIFNGGITASSSSKGYLTNTNISGIFGRSFGTNNAECSNWFLSLALQAGYTFAKVDPNQFVFSDQIDQTGITGNPSQVDLFQTYNTKNYFDFSSGFVFSKGDWMVGGAVHHMNEPNISYGGKPEDARLPKKITGHLSYRLETNTLNLKPTMITQFQGKSSVITAGAIFDYYEFPLEFGIWYRNANGVSNNSAFTFTMAVKWGELTTVTSRTKEYGNKFGISYDAEMIRPGLNTTHGSLEFGIQKEIIVNRDMICPTSTSGICDYRFPWEFF